MHKLYGNEMEMEIYTEVSARLIVSRCRLEFLRTRVGIRKSRRGPPGHCIRTKRAQCEARMLERVW
jgi:hypothetical protein